jgi:hypothetical protein
MGLDFDFLLPVLVGFGNGAPTLFLFFINLNPLQTAPSVSIIHLSNHHNFGALLMHL